MWWLLLIPTILILLAVMPVGVIVRYADSGFTVWLKILFVRYRLYPGRKLITSTTRMWMTPKRILP